MLVADELAVGAKLLGICFHRVSQGRRVPVVELARPVARRIGAADLEGVEGFVAALDDERFLLLDMTGAMSIVPTIGADIDIALIPVRLGSQREDEVLPSRRPVSFAARLPFLHDIQFGSGDDSGDPAPVRSLDGELDQVILDTGHGYVPLTLGDVPFECEGVTDAQVGAIGSKADAREHGEEKPRHEKLQGAHSLSSLVRVSRLF